MLLPNDYAGSDRNNLIALDSLNQKVTADYECRYAVRGDSE
jgi:hypothetical protein